MAGAIMQAVTRNPLASPGIMGLNTGAAFASIVALVLWPTAGRADLMVLSIAGATLEQLSCTASAPVRAVDSRPYDWP